MERGDRARVFWSGRSQAVRLPKDYRFAGKEVRIRRAVRPSFSSQRNLPLNTWPYLREFLQNALTRAGWPVYTLPAFKPAAVQLQLKLSDAMTRQ